MSISPPTDIIMDVINAAQPAQIEMANKRLAAVALQKRAALSEGKTFEKITKALTPVAKRQDVPPDLKLVPVTTKPSVAVQSELSNNATRVEKASDSKLNSAHRELEGIFLQNVISTMLKGQKGALFGKGISGDYWKSYMSKAIANKLAQGQGVGIAQVLDKSTLLSAKNVGSINSASRSSIGMQFEKLFVTGLGLNPDSDQKDKASLIAKAGSNGYS